MEEWKPIPGYEELYEASTDGRIRSKEGKITSSSLYPHRHWRSRIMKGRGENLTTGYRVGLWKNGKCKDWLVARLIGITFLGAPPYSDWTINHKDGNRHNNNVENLEWLTLADNIRHGFETGLYTCRKQIMLSRDNEHLEFKSMKEAGQAIGRGPGYISGCVRCGYKARSTNGYVYTVTLL